MELYEFFVAVFSGSITAFLATLVWPNTEWKLSPGLLFTIPSAWGAIGIFLWKVVFGMDNYFDHFIVSYVAGIWYLIVRNALSDIIMKQKSATHDHAQ